MRIKSLLAYKILREITHIITDTLLNIYRLIRFIPERIKSIVVEHRYESRFGIETGAMTFQAENTSLYKDDRRYSPTPYPILKKMADYLKLNADDVFVDLGCGKGTVVFFIAAHKI